MVLDDVRAKLASLRPVSSQLNEASDQLRDEIRTIEDELAELKLGIAVTLDQPFEETPLREEHDDDDRVVHYSASRLAYERHAGKWRIVAKRFKYVRVGAPDGYGEYRWEEFEEDSRPLLETARSTRVAAVEDIVRLVDTLHQTATKKIESILKVTDTRK